MTSSLPPNVPILWILTRVWFLNTNWISHYLRSSVALVPHQSGTCWAMTFCCQVSTQRSWGSDQVVPWDSPVPTPTPAHNSHAGGTCRPLPKVGRGHRRREGEAGEHPGQGGGQEGLGGANSKTQPTRLSSRECHALSPKCRAFQSAPLGPGESTHTSAIFKSNISTYITVILFNAF